MQCMRLLQKRATLTIYRHSENVAVRDFISFSAKGTFSRENPVLHQKHLFQFNPPTIIKGCGFHLSQRRTVHPILWVLIKPVLKLSAVLSGRGARKWYRKLDPKEKESFWDAKKYLLAGTVGTVAGLFLMYYLSHIEETPITGRKRFMALTHDQILSISLEQARALMEDNKDKMFTSQSFQAKRVMDVAANLLMANPELRKMNFDKWEVFVIQDPMINACVLPTGHVFVFEGMLNMAHTQDELAIILGHEMAHALLDHGIEGLSYGQFIDYVVIVLMAALWCIIPSDGIAFVTHWFHNKLVEILADLPHSRAVEEEADRVGAMLAAKACYDIRQGVVLWQKMEAASKIGNNEPLPAFLSTHPHNLKRAEFFNFIISQAEIWRDEMKCPLWPKTDPREAIKIISGIVDDHIAARKAGQNLAKVRVASIPGAKAAVADSKAFIDDLSPRNSSEKSENIVMTKKADLSSVEMNNHSLDLKNFNPSNIPASKTLNSGDES